MNLNLNLKYISILYIVCIVLVLPFRAHAELNDSCYSINIPSSKSQTEIKSEFGNKNYGLDLIKGLPDECVNDSCSFESQQEAHPTHLFRLKTNALGWAMLVGNAAVEFDLNDRWSISVPIYYSALNYFTSTLKFRTLCVQPEVRFWLSDNHKGWFVGAHIGAGYYNYAIGEYRVQDNRGSHPAYGAGFSTGWRFNLSADSRWQMEMTAGVGAFRARYDKFVNIPNGECLVSDVKRTFFGFDQAALSISYSFGNANKSTKQSSK